MVGAQITFQNNIRPPVTLYGDWKGQLKELQDKDPRYRNVESVTAFSGTAPTGGSAQGMINTQQNQQQYGTTQTASQPVNYSTGAPTTPAFTSQSQIDNIFAPKLGQGRSIPQQSVAPTYLSSNNSDPLGKFLFQPIASGFSYVTKTREEDYNKLYYEAEAKRAKESFEATKQWDFGGDVPNAKRWELTYQPQLTTKYNEINALSIPVTGKQKMYDAFAQTKLNEYNSVMNKEIFNYNLQQEMISRKYLGAGSEYAFNVQKKTRIGTLAGTGLTIATAGFVGLALAGEGIRTQGGTGYLKSSWAGFKSDPIFNTLALGIGVAGGYVVTKGLTTLGSKTYSGYVAKYGEIKTFPTGEKYQFNNGYLLNEQGKVSVTLGGKPTKLSGTYNLQGMGADQFGVGKVNANYFYKDNPVGNLQQNIMIKSGGATGVTFGRGTLTTLGKTPKVSYVESFGAVKGEYQSMGGVDFYAFKGKYVSQNFRVESPAPAFSSDEAFSFYNDPLSLMNKNTPKGTYYNTKGIMAYGKPTQGATFGDITYTDATTIKYTGVGKATPFSSSKGFTFDTKGWNFETNVVNKGWGDMWAPAKPMKYTTIDLTGMKSPTTTLTPPSSKIVSTGGTSFKGSSISYIRPSGGGTIQVTQEAGGYSYPIGGGQKLMVDLTGAGLMDVSAGFRTTIKGSDVFAPKFGDALGTKIPIIIGGGSKLQPKWGVKTQPPTFTETFTGGLQGEGTGIIQLPKIGSGTGLKYGDRYASANIQTQTPVQVFKQAEVTKQVSITQQRFTWKGLTPSAIPPIIPPTGIGFGFGFIPPMGDFRQPRTRRVKAKKIVRYTPSFGALIFGIKGKKPKGMETGLRVRPIPRGQFNFLSPAGSSRSSPLANIFKRFR